MSEMNEKLRSDLSTNTQYGWKKGCLITKHTYNGLQLFIYAGKEPSDTENAADIQYRRAQDAVLAIQPFANDPAYKIKNTAIAQSGTVVVVDFGTGMSVNKRCDQFIEDHLADVAPICRPHNCVYCGRHLDETGAAVMTSFGAAPAHTACVDAQNAAVDNWQPDNNKTYNTALGIVGAVFGMLLGALLWALIGMAGYVASIAGLAMAFAIGKGYDMLGGKPGKFRMVLMIVLVIVGVVLGTTGTYAWQIHLKYQETVASLKPWQTMTKGEGELIMIALKEIFTSSQSQPEVIKDIGMGLLFAALGCFGMLRSAGKHPDAPTKPRELKGGL